MDTGRRDGNVWRLKGVRQPHVRGEMNGLERRFQAEYVDPLKLAKVLVDAHFEAMTFRLAKKTHYTPDFDLVFASGLLAFVECKAGWSTGKAGYTDDARVKIKVVAEMYPHFAFVSAVHDRKAGWRFECFNIDETEWHSHVPT